MCFCLLLARFAWRILFSLRFLSFVVGFLFLIFLGSVCMGGCACCVVCCSVYVGGCFEVCETFGVCGFGSGAVCFRLCGFEVILVCVSVSCVGASGWGCFEFMVVFWSWCLPFLGLWCLWRFVLILGVWLFLRLVSGGFSAFFFCCFCFVLAMCCFSVFFLEGCLCCWFRFWCLFVAVWLVVCGSPPCGGGCGGYVFC